MALQAKIQIEGQQYSIVECEYTLSKKVNIDGTPCTGPTGGLVDLTIVSPEKARFLYEWMLSDTMKHDCMIWLDVNYNRFSRNSVRRISLQDAFCIGLYEYFNNQNSDMMTMRLSLYGTRIQFVDTMSNGIGIDNRLQRPIGL